METEALLAAMPGGLGQPSAPAVALPGGKVPMPAAVPPRTSPRSTVSSGRVLALEAVSTQVQHMLGHSNARGST